jgi:Ca2+-transporting ATPase
MNLLEVSLDKLSAILGTDMENGLAAEQVLRNRREFGENVLFEKKNTAVDLFRKIFGDVMMILFLLISLFHYMETGEIASLVAALTVVVLFGTFVLLSNLYVSKVNRKISKYSSSKFHVKRAGKILSVTKRELVPGDILILEKGDSVMKKIGIINANPNTIQKIKMVKDGALLKREDMDD